MRCLNRATILGRLIGAPRCRQANENPVCHFSIETLEEWMGKNGRQTRTIEHSCTAFGPTAEVIRNVKPGGYVLVEGSLRRGGDVNVVDGPIEIVCFVVIPMAEREAA